jgi:hypothetical protein
VPGEWSSDGADYYCASDKNEIAEFSDEQLEDSRMSLEAYRMNALAAAGASYLMLLALLLVLLPFQGARRLCVASRSELAALNAEIDERGGAAGRARVPPPCTAAHALVPALGSWCWWPPWGAARCWSCSACAMG